MVIVALGCRNPEIETPIAKIHRENVDPTLWQRSHRVRSDRLQFTDQFCVRTSEN